MSSVSIAAKKVDQFLERFSAALARNGLVVETWRKRNGRQYGPYYRLQCRVAGRKVSAYLGADGPLVATTRERLVRLRRPGRQHRAIVALYRHLHWSERAVRCQLAHELARIGLRLHGSEIRGYAEWKRVQRFALKTGNSSNLVTNTDNPDWTANNAKTLP